MSWVVVHLRLYGPNLKTSKREDFFFLYYVLIHKTIGFKRVNFNF